jgi:hypothetical protein
MLKDAWWRESVRMVGNSVATFRQSLDSTPNAEFEKVMYGCAVIQDVATAGGSMANFRLAGAIQTTISTSSQYELLSCSKPDCGVLGGHLVN